MTPDLTLNKLIEAAKQRLREGENTDFATDARFLARHAFSLDSAQLISMGGEVISDQLCLRYNDYIQRRLGGEPVGRIIGYREFYGREFQLSPATLEPRADTEILIDRVLQDNKDNQKPLRVLDLGTGTGVIIISIITNLPNASGIASDMDVSALEVGKTNARNHGVDKRIEFIASNWCDEVFGEFDIIVSNPPYIRSDVIDELDPQVRNYDPKFALDGGADGLVAYRALLEQCGSHLKSGGRLYLEIGFDQNEAVSELAFAMNWRIIASEKDYGGNDRLIVFEST